MGRLGFEPRRSSGYEPDALPDLANGPLPIICYAPIYLRVLNSSNQHKRKVYL